MPEIIPFEPDLDNASEGKQMRFIHFKAVSAKFKASEKYTNYSATGETFTVVDKKQNLIWYFLGIEFNIDNIILFVIFYLSIPA